MSKPLQPGMLCLITGAISVPENIGKPCRLIQYLQQGEKFINPPTGKRIFADTDRPVWLVYGDGLKSVRSHSDGSRYLVQDGYPLISERFLMPLDGGEDLQETEQQQVDTGVTV